MKRCLPEVKVRYKGVFKRALVGSLSINNHPYIFFTLEPFNERVTPALTNTLDAYDT